jgi:hypothetical protein
VQTVLPPGYLCCGYPQRGSGQFDKAEKMITDNRVLFHRVANTLNYLDIKTVVVSCGTCYDQLQGYEFDKIFPGCRIIDIHEYLLEKGIKLPGGGGYLYHDPCHTPMKLQEPMKTVKALVGDNVRKSERCCGESGTFGVTRPDISTQVRFRKEEELRKDEAALRASGAVGEGRHQDPHQLPELPAGPVALQPRPAERPAGGRLHRGRDGQQDPGRRLDARVRAGRQQRRHRARAGLMGAVAGCPLCDGAGRHPARPGRRLAHGPRVGAGLSRLLPGGLGRPRARVVRPVPADRQHCMDVLVRSSRRCAHLQPDKVNLAALGNAVPHLHWHVIARFDWDSRFPAPVWAAEARTRPGDRLPRWKRRCRPWTRNFGPAGTGLNRRPVVKSARWALRRAQRCDALALPRPCITLQHFSGCKHRLPEVRPCRPQHRRRMACPAGRRPVLPAGPSPRAGRR